MSLVLRSLVPAFVTLALGSALNLLGIQQGWASHFDWEAAIAVPATLAVMGWCTVATFPIGPRGKSSSKPMMNPEHNKKATYTTNLVLLMSTTGFASSLFGELLAKDRRTASVWALAAIFAVVSAAASAASSRRDRSSQLPSSDQARA